MWWQTKFHLAFIQALILALCLSLNTDFAIATESRSDNYLDIVLVQTKEKVFRFAKMPVPVFIKSESADQISACRQAFEMWQSFTRDLIAFKSVDQENSARVVIKFVRLSRSVSVLPDSDLDGGHTLMEWHSRGKILKILHHSKVHVPPQVVEINLSALDARPVLQREIALRNIIAHELGHAIGLLAHSPDPGDLMYIKTDESSGFSARDLNTVRKLYELKPDISL